MYILNCLKNISKIKLYIYFKVFIIMGGYLYESKKVKV